MERKRLSKLFTYQPFQYNDFTTRHGLVCVIENSMLWITKKFEFTDMPNLPTDSHINVTLNTSTALYCLKSPKMDCGEFLTICQDVFPTETGKNQSQGRRLKMNVDI